MSDIIKEILQFVVALLPYVGIWLSFFSLKSKQENILKQIEIYEKWQHKMTPENKLKMENHIEELIQKTEKTNWWLAHLDACNVYILIIADIALFLLLVIFCYFRFSSSGNILDLFNFSLIFFFGVFLYLVFLTIISYKSYKNKQKPPNKTSDNKQNKNLRTEDKDKINK